MHKDEEASLFLALEQAVKGLSIGNDQSSTTELRRLLEGFQAGEAVAPEGKADDCEPTQP